MTSEYLVTLGQEAKKAARKLRALPSGQKNRALNQMAAALRQVQADILKANQIDLEAGATKGLSAAFLERLTLTPERIEAMAQGLESIAALPDPLQKIDQAWQTEDGLWISRKRVPLGVIGIIYESRPNVTVDATALCLKAGNAVILRGGRDALQSNMAIMKVLRQALSQANLDPNFVQMIDKPDHSLAKEFMQLNDYVDCLIPRGGAGLIQNVIKHATVPVIETGVGNCHLYIHQAADIAKARQILENGKLQRVSVCNALESLLIDAAIVEQLPDLVAGLIQAGVEIRGNQKVCQFVPQATSASESDYAREFNDYILSVKVVDDYQAAIDHIDRYSTGHSEAIVTEDYQVAENFLADVDAAAVYVNASTRFTDGQMFGFGGEIGISTQKLHARGPMGLDALTSYKYQVRGQGQVRS